MVKRDVILAEEIFILQLLRSGQSARTAQQTGIARQPLLKRRQVYGNSCSIEPSPCTHEQALMDHYERVHKQKFADEKVRSSEGLGAAKQHEPPVCFHCTQARGRVMMGSNQEAD